MAVVEAWILCPVGESGFNIRAADHKVLWSGTDKIQVMGLIGVWTLAEHQNLVLGSCFWSVLGM
jgi:hypothetical protein